MTETRRYAIPPTRLPFVNAEIAQVQFRGAPHLVSSVWAGGSGGRLHFWNPDTGDHAMRMLPDAIPGAYMLRPAADGSLFLGCGTGELVRYDPDRDAFTVPVRGELNSITWGGTVVGDRVFWNAARAGKPGAVAVYDRRSGKVLKVFAPVDSESPTALYGHTVVLAPDRRLVWNFNVPQGRLITIDVDTLEARSHTPDYMVGSAWSRLYFVDDHRAIITLAGHHAVARAVLAAYPGFHCIEDLPLPPGNVALGGRGVMLGGDLLQLDAETGDLWRLDVSAREWHCVERRWTRGTHATLGVWQGRNLCAVTMYGEALRRRADSGRTDRLDLESTGPLAAHALCAVPERNLIVGAPFINQRFWTIDTGTGEGRDLGQAAPGGGQVNQIIWDPLTRRALLSSYTSASITAYDPSRPAAWPENPRLLASAHEQGQMRPLDLVHDGRHVWMATSPQYGTLGGALCRLDPTTGTMDVWPHLVRDQRPNAVRIDPARRRLFFSTDVYADCGSCPPTEDTARIVAFDMDRCKIAAARVVRERCPDVRLRAVLPDGRALLSYENTLSAWNADDDSLEPLGPWPADVRAAIAGPGASIIAASASHVGLLRFAGGQYIFKPKVAATEPKFLHVVGDTLFFAAGLEVWALPLAELGL